MGRPLSLDELMAQLQDAIESEARPIAVAQTNAIADADTLQAQPQIQAEPVALEATPAVPMREPILVADEVKQLLRALRDVYRAPLVIEPAYEQQAVIGVLPPIKGWRKVLRIGVNLLSWGLCLIIVGATAFAVNPNPKKSFFGYYPYSVWYDSMTPAEDGSSPSGGFRAGDVILVKMSNPEEVQVGDIVTFSPANLEDKASYLTHRVMRIIQENGVITGIVTKGDANSTEDPVMNPERLVGKKIACIPSLGPVLDDVCEHPLLAGFTAGSFLACIVLIRWYFSAPKPGESKPLHTLSRTMAGA